MTAAESSGPVRFDHYVDRCLYDAMTGFYAVSGEAGGRHGDFITSPEVGSLFGAVLARYLDGVWAELGRPDEFHVVEAGAGRGALAKSILAAVPECGAALHYRTVERSARLRDRQRELLGERVELSDELPAHPIIGVVLANELLDNLAVRIVQRTAVGWSELFVADEGEVLIPCDDPPAPVRDGAPAVGDRAPWCEQAASWVDDALGLLQQGRLLAIDYGVGHTAELAGREWLRTYRHHVRGSDPLVDPGSADITVDVPFDQLPPPTSLETQAQFLHRYGIEELVEQGRRVWQERAHIGDLAAIAARSRVTEAEALLDATGLGGFLVAEWRR